MKKKLMGLFFITNCFGATWSGVFDAHETILSKDSILRKTARTFLAQCLEVDSSSA